MKDEIKEKQFEELQKTIDREKAKVKSGELSLDMFDAWLAGYLSGELFRYYGKVPNITVED